MKTASCQGKDGKVTENYDMPVISMFYGIIIRMYFLDNQHHRGASNNNDE